MVSIRVELRDYFVGGIKKANKNGEATKESSTESPPPEWTSGAIVRYRSMRVMMKMSTDPSFRQFHNYKIAAMEKTIAFPTTSVLNLASLSVIIAFVLIIFGLIAQLIINRRS